MICPYCRAENSDSALRCTRCNVTFAVVDDGVTIGGFGEAAPQGKPQAQSPDVAAGVMTPPPSPSQSGSSSRAGSIVPGSGSGSGSMPSWPTYMGRVVNFEPGTEFGPRYRIESMIGEGGMGTVYAAYDKDLDRVVALKLLRAELTSDSGAMQRFKQELLLASKISHKHILRIHDMGDAGGIRFISMAYVKGKDLHAILKEQGRLPVDRALSITRQLCGALEAAHHEGVVHRDLKPHNVLVDEQGNCYISDFGLAKSLEAGAIGMTRSGEYLGTPRYMSPEQVEAKPIDHRSDLFALGLIIYEMVTGDVPFTGDSTLQVMYRRVKEKAKNPKLLNPELPDHVVRIIMKCLERNPDDRYQNAREILHDIDAERAPSRSVSLQIRLPDTAKQKWVWAAAGVLVIAAILFAIPASRNFILRRPTAVDSAGAITAAGVPALSQGRFVAVLPFRILGDQNALGYVGEGLVEGLSAKLFQLKDVRVASASAVADAAKRDSLEKIARSLGVNLVVQGTVQGGGDRIRIIVNLEDVAGGRRVWSQQFSGVVQDLLTIEDQIYGELVNALELNLSNEEMARGAARPTGNIDAYDVYLRGRNTMRTQKSVKEIEEAIKLYEQALQKDATFALAYAGIADASLQMYREKKDRFWSERALGAALQAQRLNDNAPEVHYSLGSVYITTGKPAEAISELNRALQLAPNSDEGYRRLAAAYLAAGRKDEALQAYQKAVDVNPYYWLNYNTMGSAYLQFGQTAKALEAFKRVTELEPDNPVGHENIGAAYFAVGKIEQAIPAFQKALEKQPHPATYSNLGTAFFYLKRYNESVPMFEKAVEMNPNEQISMGNLADAYRWSGQAQKAGETYDKAIALCYKELQVNPRKADVMGSLALYYAKKGDHSQAAEFARRARSTDANRVSLIYIDAVTKALAGKNDAALAALKEAFQRGYPPEEAQNDPELKSLQALPQFQKLVESFASPAAK